MARDPTELEVLLARYSSFISIDDKDAFVAEHPELKHKGVAVRSLLTARQRYDMGDFQAAARYACAAFCLAGDLSDKDLGAEAADVLADACAAEGVEENAVGWRLAALTLRAGLD